MKFIIPWNDFGTCVGAASTIKNYAIFEPNPYDMCRLIVTSNYGKLESIFIKLDYELIKGCVCAGMSHNIDDNVYFHLTRYTFNKGISK